MATLLAKSAALQSDLLDLIFGRTIPSWWSYSGSPVPQVNLYVQMCTADPGVAGVPGDDEIVYTGYARLAVERTIPTYWTKDEEGGAGTGDWRVRNTLAWQFGRRTNVGADPTATYLALVTSSSGATGRMLYRIPMPSLVIAQNDIPLIPALSVTIKEK